LHASSNYPHNKSYSAPRPARAEWQGYYQTFLGWLNAIDFSLLYCPIAHGIHLPGKNGTRSGIKAFIAFIRNLVQFFFASYSKNASKSFGKVAWAYFFQVAKPTVRIRRIFRHLTSTVAVQRRNPGSVEFLAFILWNYF